MGGAAFANPVFFLNLYPSYHKKTGEKCTYHARMDTSLLNVSCNACNKCISIFKISVEVWLYEEATKDTHQDRKYPNANTYRKKLPVLASPKGNGEWQYCQKANIRMDVLVPGKAEMMEGVLCMVVDLVMVILPRDPHWTKHPPK